MKWVPNWLCSNSSPVKQETIALQRDDKRDYRMSRDSDVSKEPEDDEMQPEKRQKRMDEQSMVLYCQDQGSSSNSLITCHLDWPCIDSSLYPRIVTLKDKMVRLFARRSDVLTELKHAEIQVGKKRRKEVHHWLTAVQLKKDEVQRMIKDGQGTSSNSKLSRCINRCIEEVDELIQRGKFSNGLVLLDHESTILPLYLGIKPIGINFQKNIEKIMGWLRNQEHGIIGIYGMGGVGKTTLLMQLHNQLLQDSDLYGQVYWVTVSKNCTVHKLQEDIAKVLGVENLGVYDEKKRTAVLHNRLASMGPTVLILDDLWKPFIGSEFGIPLEGTTCKIIVSTRLLEVCRKMGCKDFVIKAEVLSDDEAWDLFVDNLGHYHTLSAEAKELARTVAQECGGLPLAIATMARSMTHVVHIHEWKIAVNELKSACSQADMEAEVLRILQCSYDRLNDKRVQNCFLSCILYGEDRKIMKKTLIDVWIYEGLLDEIESRDIQVAKGYAILNKLESWCLLESTVDEFNKDCVKMHDLIRDMGIMITKNHPRFLTKAGVDLEQVPEEEHWSKDLAKVSLSDNKIEEIPTGMAPITPKLTVLMLRCNYRLKKIPDSFFVYMQALTVLDLSWTGIKRVPESVSDLKNLRALLVANCGMLSYLPPVSKLTKLRVLDVQSCNMLEAAPEGLERLKRVENVSYCPWNISEVSRFNELIHFSSPSLSCYRFWIRDPKLYKTLVESRIEVEVDDHFYWSWSYEKVVWITGGEFEEDGSSLLLPNTLEMLGMNRSDMKGKSLGDVFPSLGMAKATYLKVIRLQECRGLKYILLGPPSLSCSQLEVLDLLLLPDIISITKFGAPDLFTHLQELLIWGCPKIKLVFPFTEQPPHLPNLKIMKVSECEELEEIFDSDKVTQSNNFIIHLPNLKQLHLGGLPKLGCIYRGPLLCTSLQKSIIQHCPKLKLFPLQEFLLFCSLFMHMEI